MKYKSKWAIIIASALIVSLVMVSSPVAACFNQTTSCEGESVYQGDGGSTDYWRADLYPPEHYLNSGEFTEWIINVDIAGVCSAYEHATITDNTPPSGWSTSIIMGEIYSGSFTYIVGGGPVSLGDDIEGKEIYLGRSCDFDIKYRITAPPSAPGGEQCNMICTVNVVGYSPENQHDYVYVYCSAILNAVNPPLVGVSYPNGGETLSGTVTVEWAAKDPDGNPMTYDVLLSDDGGISYPYTLATGLPDAVKTLSWDTTLHLDGVEYRIKVIAFDGVDYGIDVSDNDFALDNYPPNPPPEIIIQLDLTTDGEPLTKAPEDNTGSSLGRIKKDDGEAYAVQKGETLSMETFNTGIQTEPILSAQLVLEYWVENIGYSGTESVMWKLETDPTFNSTGITPINTEQEPVVATFDLYANGVDTLDKIANLDIQFLNGDGGTGQIVNFDYIWVKIRGCPGSLGLIWEPSPSPDIDHYHIHRSPDNSIFTQVDETSYTSWYDAGKGTDMNNYFYQIHGVDSSNNEGLASYTVAKYITSISSGWNVASIPLIQTAGNSLNLVLQSVDSDFTSIQTYHAGNSKPWLHWRDSKPSELNSLVDMNHEDGYYLKMKTSEDVINLGRVPVAEILSLKAGWNLVGYPSLVSNTRTTALASISAHCDAVYRLDPATGRDIPVNGGDSMNPGEGYWIHVTQNCDLTL